jgi:hypothetical protein
MKLFSLTRLIVLVSTLAFVGAVAGSASALPFRIPHPGPATAPAPGAVPFSGGRTPATPSTPTPAPAAAAPASPGVAPVAPAAPASPAAAVKGKKVALHARCKRIKHHRHCVGKHSNRKRHGKRAGAHSASLEWEFLETVYIEETAGINYYWGVEESYYGAYYLSLDYEYAGLLYEYGYYDLYENSAEYHWYPEYETWYTIEF